MDYSGMTDHLKDLCRALGRDEPQGLSQDEVVAMVSILQEEWMNRNG